MSELRVLVVERPENAYLNLAIEEAVTRARGRNLVPDTLRIWRNRNAVIVGLFQITEDEVDIEECVKLSVQVVRRFTGGGTVYHDLGNINYAIALHRSDKRPPPSILESYRYFGQAVVYALKKLGVEDAGLGKVNDIVIGRRKVGGTAQTRMFNAIFYHGTLLTNTDIEKMAKLLKISKAKLSDKGVSSLRERVVNVREILGHSPDFNEVVQALIEGFSKVLGVNNVEVHDDLTDIEWEIAYDLYENKYSKNEWNMGRVSKKYLFYAPKVLRNSS